MCLRLSKLPLLFSTRTKVRQTWTSAKKEGKEKIVLYDLGLDLCIETFSTSPHFAFVPRENEPVFPKEWNATNIPKNTDNSWKIPQSSLWTELVGSALWICFGNSSKKNKSYLLKKNCPNMKRFSWHLWRREERKVSTIGHKTHTPCVHSHLARERERALGLIGASTKAGMCEAAGTVQGPAAGRCRLL